MGFDLGESRELEKMGSFLSIARLERGLSQAELAARCVLSQAQISYFEVGQRRPTLDQFLRIAKALDHFELRTGRLPTPDVALDQLLADRLLLRANALDPWGHFFRVEAADRKSFDSGLNLKSAGPDGLWS